MATTETESMTDCISQGGVSDGSLLLVLRGAALLCFTGWTWGHLYWEGPYGVLLWQDSTYELAGRLGISWGEFVGTGADDGWLQRWVSRIGWLYLGFTVLTVSVRKSSYVQMAGLLAGSGMLAVLSYSKYVAAQNQLPMLMEHGGQVLAPALLVAALALGVRHRVTVAIAIAAVITTFAGHGAYAIGWWPTPGNFYAMISLTLGVEYETATNLLRCAGVLDFAVCLLLFVPRLRRSAAAYAAIWGFLTAVARPVAGMSWELNYWGADQFLHEVVLRAPHYLIPLYLVAFWHRSENAQDCDVG